MKTSGEDYFTGLLPVGVPVEVYMKDTETKRNIRRTVTALVVLTLVILALFVYSVIRQGNGG